MTYETELLQQILAELKEITKLLDNVSTNGAVLVTAISE